MDGTRSQTRAAAFGGALLMLAAHVAAKATRDALFLSHFDVTVLPRAMLAAAVVSLACAAGMSRLLQRSAPRDVVPPALLVSALLFAAEWVLLARAPRIAAVSVYLHFAGLGAILISGFWSVVNERFDPHSGKAVVARTGGFAALGGVVGGLAAERVSAWFGVPAMLPTLGLLHLCAAGAILYLGRGSDRTPAARDGEAADVSGLRTLRQTPLLVQMAVLVSLVAVIDALLDYALKATATAQLAGGEALIQFFALFYTLAGLVAFALQASVGTRVLRALGLGGAIALAPVGVIVASLGAAAVPRLLTVGLARGAAFALSNSFFRAGFELLYTPIPPEVKRPTKAWVDVGAQRLGDMLGGGTILVLLFFLPGLTARTVVLLAVGVCLVCLWIITQLHRGYVSQLAESLRSGVISLREEEAVDLTTTRTLAETHVAIDRAELQARIRAVQRAQEGEREPDEALRTAAGRGGAQLDGLLEALRALHDPSPEVVRAALDGASDDPGLVPHVLELLERYDVHADAVAYLRAHAAGNTGQLIDALLDPSRGLLVRRRLPQVLEAAGDRRALDGLLLGLADGDFDVRLECGRAAARMVLREPTLRLEATDVEPLVQRELAIDPRVFEQHGRRRDGVADESVLLEATASSPISRSLDHVFTVLGLAFGPELMGSALRGVHAPDANLRGTALEYLETTLPDGLFRVLRAQLPAAGARARGQRAREEVAEELGESSSSFRAGRS